MELLKTTTYQPVIRPLRESVVIPHREQVLGDPPKTQRAQSPIGYLLGQAHVPQQLPLRERVFKA